MRKVIRNTSWIAALVFGLCLLAASAAQAQYREFSGQIQKIGAGKLIVDNRMGDKVMFVRLKGTVVEDQRPDEAKKDDEKKKWTDLKRDDWVTVQWKMIDKPRKAYKIIVLPPKEDAAEDM